ncbi:DHA2 family efflux MFS transporter permease subunit [Nocardiopsis baichengensis]|uniref:DHA2 family efflux MFS transporter permease subunit n=1 Tax=Nocardiopsis baichengensis TaxID=280240 RepID=UPI000348AEF0|nr:DHA2 family efflux MFS transporter permease subunit [Nocardiopsis baichengensis]
MTPLTPARRRIVLVMATLASMLLVVDITIVSVGLPRIQADLGGTLAGVQWVIIAYALALGASLQTVGGLSDRYGRRRVFILGIAVFTLASLACGAAPSVLALNVFRLLQGVGAAMVMVNSLALISQTHEGQERNMAIAIWSTALSASGAAAPVLGGLIVDYTDWRWMFLINVPIGLVAFLLAVTRLPAEEPTRRSGRLDLPGALLLVAALALVNLGLTRGEDQGWAAPATLGLFAATALAAGVFIAVERRASDPMLDLSLFRTPSFTAAALMSFLTRVVTIGGSVYFVLYFQVALGRSPFESGLLLLPVFLLQIPAGILAGKAMARFSAARIIITGYSAKLLAAVLLALVFVPDASVWSLVGPLALWGLGGGIASAPIMAVGMGAVPAERHGMASGTINSLFSIGAATGTALLGVVYKARIGAAAAADPALAEGERADVAHAAATGDVDRIAELTSGAARNVAEVVERAVASGASAVMFTAAGVAVLTLLIAATMVRQSDISGDEEEAESEGGGAEHRADRGPGTGEES